MAAVSPPMSPITATTPHQRVRPTSMIMPKHTRTTSKYGDVASRSSDEDAAKTAVKVAVRVRPPLKPTDPGFDLIPQRFRESTCDVPTANSLAVQSPQGKKLFVFDRVFDEQTTQEGIWEYVSDGVSSFVKGYNVSILAYGQSGAGKSYTMGTSAPEDLNNEDVRGIIPRAAQALFEKLGATGARPSGLQTPKRYSTPGVPTMGGKRASTIFSKTWELKATYVEIYNEQLRDLLVPEHVAPQDRPQVAIREDTKGRIMLTGLTQVPINSAEDLLNALEFGSSIRQTDATAINARSSRSHAVFSLNLVQKKDDVPPLPTSRAEKRMSMPVEAGSGGDGTVTIDSKLHFVDLAGSERLKNTGATGDRAKEGISINAGLASLGKVISQLSSKNSHGHISYRDSRLTRLLQDSLGGNAITFMVACVTPAVFHLSETLNTVHYAQRARAIQSRPEIQQTHEDEDKQAAIDRLRAEISFLRDQIRHGEHNGTRDADKQVRSERTRGRENELQTQLLDMQENYNALSQRHAKLISEISKVKDDQALDTPLLSEAIGQNANDRIIRSNSFAEAVEQVVLEYEKTIQSLESSLSKTRSSLSNTESELLEKETRIAYLDTIQHQLQARVQKYIDREANADSYTRDLESKMEGAATTDERKDTLITELKKEIARVRETESNSEDYISTLEERLAEAEQDAEIMQRQIDRLEHVVERQRSVGKLDNILGELDGLRQDSANASTVNAAEVPLAKTAEEVKVNGHHKPADDDEYDPFRPAQNPDAESVYDDEVEDERKEVTEHPMTNGHAHEDHAPTQNDFVAEKLENLTLEFFDLRSEHEAVLNDYDNLQQKYRTALETLAKMEYDKDAPKDSLEEEDTETSQRFLPRESAETKEEEEESRSTPTGRSALPQSSLRSPLRTLQTSIINGKDTESVVGEDNDSDELAQEMDTLNKLHTDKDVSMDELSASFTNLLQKHETTLSQMRVLRAEVQRAQQINRADSPSFSASSNFSRSSMRRRSDELLASGSDRASRSYVSLKTIAMNNFDENDEIKQTFEQNLTTVMSELHSRSERVKSLEAELGTVKKDMESKQTIISGLTRERSSLKAAAASGVDFSVIGQMRDQLLESENQIRTLHEQQAVREKEFQEQIVELKKTISEREKSAAKRMSQLPTINAVQSSSDAPGGFPITPSEDQTLAGQEHEDVVRLQKEVTEWESKHQDAMTSMQASQANLLNTIADLQSSLRKAENSRDAPLTPNSIHSMHLEDADDFAEERKMHKHVVDLLQKEVQDQKTLLEEHHAKFDALQSQHTALLAKSEKPTAPATETSTAADEAAANMQRELDLQKTSIAEHQANVQALQKAHRSELEDIALELKILQEDSDAKHATIQKQHADSLATMQVELQKAQTDITRLLQEASKALGFQTDASQLHTQIKGLVEEGKELHGRHLKTTSELKNVQEELQTVLSRSVESENQLRDLKLLSEERDINLRKMTEKYGKAARLVEELEEQLNTTFDSHQATNKRLSTFQTDAVAQRQEIERELEEQKLRYQALEAQLAAAQRQSVASNGSHAFNRDSLSPEAAAIALARSASSSSNARKSAAVTALPTPPPSIPLPPLPGSPTSASPLNSLDAVTERAVSPSGTNYSPPGSRHTSHNLETQANNALMIEEQEARIRTIEKHLFAEKQLTATLEEALVDLETSANRTKAEMESWRKKANTFEDELVGLRKERSSSRASLQQVEEEREMRVRAERARQALEQRMMELNASKKKKKNALNCF